ncbi:PAS domain-containing sensor histidine kinase [Aquabacterium sp. J223]|uniref:sensor histidine kinase n=1 Tax=Aquabacterium sp. J223 TaxID=2898431 RepID=UPI0021ADBFFA|nr:PAS domain-containing sensor histidine kinase [Aquabacterium sp. J223]UUX95475.1 PAS domain-containing protein [Aquabacterium sp. J223]
MHADPQAQSVLESITDAFFAIDGDWRFTYVNRQAEVVLGRGRDELLGRSLWEAYPGLVGSRFESVYRRVAAGGATETVTDFYPDHDRWYEVHVYPAAPGITLYFRDVTERLKADQAVREQGERLHQALQLLEGVTEGTEDLIAALDPDLRYTVCNAAYRRNFMRLFGRTIDVGDSMVEALAALPEDQAMAVALFSRALAGETVHVQCEFGDTAHARRLFDQRFYPLRDADGRIVGAGEVAVDITDQAAAERALRESEARFRTLADNMDQLAWMAEPDGRLTWVNQRWSQFTGLDTEALLDPVQRRSVVHPDHLAPVLAHWAAARERGEPWEHTFPMRRADGVDRWFLSRALPIRDEHGAIVRWFGTHTDVTRGRETEAALRQADHSKDEFMAMLAHELRNPLAPLRNMLALLERRQDAELLPKALALMGRQVDQLGRLVEDLLDGARIKSGKIGLKRERLDLTVVLLAAVETSRPLWEPAGHELALALPGEPLWVDGDRQRLEQVFTNLVNNAAKYTPSGGRLRLGAQVTGDAQVLVTVADNGTGIPSDMLDQVFTLFSQVDGQSPRAQGGLGIGLAIVRSLVQMHGGRVTAHSDGPGRGSEFRVWLPLDGAPG